MRYFTAIISGLAVGLLANEAPAQVAAMGGMGMANPSVAAGNMNMGASVANVGGNTNFGNVRSGVGGGYGGTTGASAVGSSMSGAGGYPTAAGDARYFGQNSGTVAGVYGTGAAIANQPGQPFAQSRYRSAFTNGGVTNYNPSVQARFGGPNNGQGYAGQSFGQGNAQGYAVPNYGWAARSMAGGEQASMFNYVNLPGGSNGALNTRFPVYTSGQYAPNSTYGNGPAFNYPAPNGLAPGSY